MFVRYIADRRTSRQTHAQSDHNTCTASRGVQVIVDRCCNDCVQTEESRRSADYEGLDQADVEILRLPQRPHDYASISSTQPAATQRHDVLAGEVGESLQVKARAFALCDISKLVNISILNLY